MCIQVLCWRALRATRTRSLNSTCCEVRTGRTLLLALTLSIYSALISCCFGILSTRYFLLVLWGGKSACIFSAGYPSALSVVFTALHSHHFPTSRKLPPLPTSEKRASESRLFFFLPDFRKLLSLHPDSATSENILLGVLLDTEHAGGCGHVPVLAARA